MPSWETHCTIAERLGIDKYICEKVNLIIDSEGRNKEHWSKVRELIRIKRLEYLQDNGVEIENMIRESLWHHDSRRDVRSFFVKSQASYDTFGYEGLKAYFLHHALDIVHYYRCPKYFGIEIDVRSELTRAQERDILNWAIYGFSKGGICLYKLRDYRIKLNLVQEPNLIFVFYHYLTEDVFTIEEGDDWVAYSFNDRVKELVEEIKIFLQLNISEILDVIYRNDCEKGILGEI